MGTTEDLRECTVLQCAAVGEKGILPWLDLDHFFSRTEEADNCDGWLFLWLAPQEASLTEEEDE